MKFNNTFWDRNPCGVEGNYLDRLYQRYSMEPWLPELLKKIGTKGGQILEIGCGQGIDSMEMAKYLHTGTITSIDLSLKSLEIAKSDSIELLVNKNISKDIIYINSDCESLPFPEDSFDVIYSMGVLHHTANIENAISEIFRTLKPGGITYVALYRKFSLKVFIANIARKIAFSLGNTINNKFFVYEKLRQFFSSHSRFGTMFHECFGVPILNSYSKKDCIYLFSKQLEILEIISIGPNLGMLSPFDGRKPSYWGYYWLLKAGKLNS